MIKEKKRAPRNHTLQVSEAKIDELSKNLISVNAPVHAIDFINTTIQGNLFEMIDYFPSEFVDLMIIDPPYNLSRDFVNVKFKQMTDDDYSDYLESWFPKLIRLLKPNASLYLCGDWKKQRRIKLYRVFTRVLFGKETVGRFD